MQGTNATGSAWSRRQALQAGAVAGLGLAGGISGQERVAAQATSAGTATRTVLSLDGALAAVTAARAKADEIGVPMVIVVVDDSGILKAFARMDGTGVASIDLATGKAYTAAAFRAATSDLAERVSQDPARLASFTNAPGVVLLAGGIPLKSGDAVVGGIGCGGGTPEQDTECAKVGADALAGM